MKFLFLDDEIWRHQAFKKAHPKLDVVYTWTAEEAIAALKETVFEEISLDHDLGGVGSQMSLPDAGSGYDVACYVAEMPKDRRPKATILHSYNPAGVNRMRQALAACREEGMKIIIIPFDY